MELIKNDMILEHFLDADVSDIELPIITIYDNPKDYPGKFVARLFDINKPTNCITLADTLEEIRETLPYGMIPLMRHPKDDEKIVEVWI